MTSHCTFPCVPLRRMVKKLSVIADYRRNIKEYNVRPVKLGGNIQQFLMLDFLPGCHGTSQTPHHYPLIIPHYKAL